MTRDKSLNSDCAVSELWVSRSTMMIEARRPDSSVLWKAQVGIGRGGLVSKTSMQDLVTPTGEFVVDLVLYKDPHFSKVSPSIIERYSNDERFSVFFTEADGLERLFANMNRIDFDEDGSPDGAYGTGYIGLDSKSAITGPKMRFLGDVAYWFSIALHGTPDPGNIGKANSGGCIHLDPKTIEWLIAEIKISPGLKVRIVE